MTVEHLAFTSGAVFCGAIPMLLLGTEVLSWQWLFLFAVAGLVITFWRVRARMIDRYRVAQVVDRKLSLSDALPTAWFLLQNPQTGEIAFADAQIERAGDAARDVNAASVFPFVWRRAWALTGALAAVAFGLFALRYLITDSLGLKQALIPMSFSLPAEALEQLETLAGRPNRAHSTGEGKKSGLLRAPGAKRDDGPEVDEKSSKQALTQANAASGGTGPERPDATEGAPRQDGQPTSGKQNDEQSSKDGKGAGDGKGVPDHSSQRERSGDTQEAKGQQPNASERPGLMNRMKDALSGMMAKMRLQEANGQKSSEQERSGQNSKPGEGDAKSNSEAGQRDASRSESQKAQGQGREQAGVGQAQADASEKSNTTQAHASDESANRKGSDAQSGVGRQNGDKAIKEAEQLRAMGKLDEIIGKRSANLTGDISIETNSAQQQLQTRYSGRTARHIDPGREIDRDEIPVALQKYVREYMEQVRKQADRQ